MMAATPPKRLLVTGAAGFIGSHIVDRLLAQGQQVWGLDNFDPFYPVNVKAANLEEAGTNSNFSLAEGDLRDEAFLRDLFRDGQFEAVVHMAARPGDRPSKEAPEEYYDCNIMGVVRLLETMRRFQVNSLVFGSSSSVYGGRRSGPFSEDDLGDHPLSPYAASKRASELLCRTHWNLNGLRCYCLRLFAIYGPRQRPDLAIHAFTRELFAGRPIPVYGDGTAERDYTYVDDAVDAICAALGHVLVDSVGSGFETLNIGSNRTLTVNELVRLLGEAMGAEPTIRYLPLQQGDVPFTCADITRARDVLGYEPKVPLEEGLRRFVAWFLSKEEMASIPKRRPIASSS